MTTQGHTQAEKAPLTPQSTHSESPDFPMRQEETSMTPWSEPRRRRSSRGAQPSTPSCPTVQPETENVPCGQVPPQAPPKKMLQTQQLHPTTPPTHTHLPLSLSPSVHRAVSLPFSPLFLFLFLASPLHPPLKPSPLCLPFFSSFQKPNNKSTAPGLAHSPSPPQ